MHREAVTWYLKYRIEYQIKQIYQEYIKDVVIYRALQIGYTAGINANTTQTLRKMRECNSEKGEM